MMLGDLIEQLSQAVQSAVLKHGFGEPKSYRGDYSQLAFEPATNVTVESMLAHARSALGRTFTGYKGGDYTASGYTDCYLAKWGETGDPITAAVLECMFDTALRERPSKDPAAKANTATALQIEMILTRASVVSFRLGNKTCVVQVRLANGFEMTETSACVDPANYSEEIGQRIALDRIRKQLWLLEGWRLACQLGGEP